MAGDNTRYVLAVDLGTGGPKVALVSADGEVAGYEVDRTGLTLLPGGGAEQDPAEWWSAVSGAVKRLLARGLVPAERIVGIGVTAQWMGTVPIDRDGNHLANAIIWMDARGGKYARRITKGGLINISGYSVPRLMAWLRITGGLPSRTGKDSMGHILFIQNEMPEVYARTWKFLEPMDYLNYRLTGIAAAAYDTITGVWVTDNRDLRRVRYVEKLIRWSGIDREKLPDLRPTGSVLGKVRPEIAKEFGLREDVQVVMGTPDTESAAIGSGAVRDYEPHLYIGTSSWLTCHVPYKRVDIGNNITSLPSGIPGRYLVATEQDIAGGCLTVLRDQVFWAEDGLTGEPAPEDALERFNLVAEGVPAGSGRLIFTPWLNGERTPVESHYIRGGFFNQSLSTTRAHMVRSVFEGVAYNTRWMHETVEKYTKRRLDGINFIGGGAQSDLWCQIHADVLDRRIRQVQEPRLANVRGAAFTALVALGYLRFEDIPERVRIVREYEPEPANRSLYDEMFREFIAIYKNNKEAFARLNGRR